MKRRSFLTHSFSFSALSFLMSHDSFNYEMPIIILPPISLDCAINIQHQFDKLSIPTTVERVFVIECQRFYMLTSCYSRKLSQGARVKLDILRIILTGRAIKYSCKSLRGSCPSDRAGGSPAGYNINECRVGDLAPLRLGHASLVAGNLPGIWREPRNILAITAQISVSTVNRSGISNLLSKALHVDLRTINEIIRNANKMYRVDTFNGRRIVRPNIILKAIQKIIAVCLFKGLSYSNYEFSFGKRKAIKNIAVIHSNKQFVLKTDIEKFFPSIESNSVREMLMLNGFNASVASDLLKLITVDGALPEGSPSSPSVASALLAGMDNKIGDDCKKMGLNYSRYVDDITISGGNAHDVISFKIRMQKYLLRKYNLHLNREKTKLMPRSVSQKVLGCVVNEKVQPSRKWRREVRSQLHNWACSGRDAQERKRILGKLAYWREFDHEKVKHLWKKYSIE